MCTYEEIERKQKELMRYADILYTVNSCNKELFETFRLFKYHGNIYFSHMLDGRVVNIFEVK